jgi:hypothetical protein
VVITDYEQVYWAAKGNKIPVMVLVRNSEYACQIMKNGSKNKKCPQSILLNLIKCKDGVASATRPKWKVYNILHQLHALAELSQPDHGHSLQPTAVALSDDR